MTTDVLNLFPLHTVLFPYQLMPLQIFEPRYLSMFDDCITLSRPFGICLIEEGSETGPPAIPYKIGTSARIKSLHKLNDSLWFVIAEGEQRFTITRLLREQPYIQVEVEWVDEIFPDFPGDYQALEDDLTKLLAKIPAEKLPAKLKIPTDRHQLFGLVGALLSGVPEEKQKILELSQEEIVPALIDLLRAAINR